MRILYWYTRFLTAQGKERRYHSREEFELNLSTDTRFQYVYEDDHWSIQMKKESPLPKGFWGKGIYNLSVLTGDNGAGKSTIISTMMDSLCSLYNQTYQCDDVLSNDEIVIIFEVNKQRYLFHHPGASQRPKVSVGTSGLCYCRPGDKEFNELLNAIKRTKLIYLTNTLCEADDIRVRTDCDKNNHIRYHFLYDCSTCGAMRFDVSDDCRSESTNDMLMTYFTNEIYKQVKFVCAKDSTILEKLREKGQPAPLPKTLYITIHGPQFISDDSGRKSFREFLSDSQYDNLLIYRICLSCYDSFIGNLIESKYLSNGKYIWSRIIPSSLNIKDWENAFRAVFSDYFSDYADERSIRLAKNCMGFIRFLCEDSVNLRHILVLQDDINELLKGESIGLSISLNNNEGNTAQENKAWLSKFIGLYRLTCRPHYFLDFNWGLSSGENNILRLFSSLYYAFGYEFYDKYHYGKDAVCNAHSRNSKPTLCDTIILFLDEADLTYHPEWQRQFISLITAFLPELFNKSCGITDIQLLLTTHSPLLIGDFPKSCVTYLGDTSASGRIETFGQNIHLILRDSFFLHKGTIGAFAESKINHTASTLIGIINRLNTLGKNKNSHSRKEDNSLVKDTNYMYYKKYRKNLADCYQLIELVAPGVLKNKLLELYREAERLLDRAEGRNTKSIKVVYFGQ